MPGQHIDCAGCSAYRIGSGRCGGGLVAPKPWTDGMSSRSPGLDWGVIHHVSIPARDPQYVAGVLAELLGGRVSEFGPWPGGYIAWAADQHGTAVEVYPLGTELLPDAGAGQATFRQADDPSPYVATHAAVSVDRSEDEARDLAERAGWRAVRLPRGGFDVIELWIENAVMIEVLTPEMAADYLATVPRPVGSSGSDDGG